MSEAAPGAEAVKLHCLRGQSPSPEVAGDLRQILALPEAARRRFWDVLGPSLGDPIPREVEGLVQQFITAHGADRDAVTRALKAARVLVRLASAADLDAARFGEDLAALDGGMMVPGGMTAPGGTTAPGGATALGGTTTLGDVLLPGYERGKARVKAEIARQTVAEHGRLLEAVRWRIDLMSASDRGAGLRLPVVTLTLHYREGSRREQLSLQVLPDVLKQLRGVCDRVLGRK